MWHLTTCLYNACVSIFEVNPENQPVSLYGDYSIRLYEYLQSRPEPIMLGIMGYKFGKNNAGIIECLQVL